MSPYGYDAGPGPEVRSPAPAGPDLASAVYRDRFGGSSRFGNLATTV